MVIGRGFSVTPVRAESSGYVPAGIINNHGPHSMSTRFGAGGRLMRTAALHRSGAGATEVGPCIRDHRELHLAARVTVLDRVGDDEDGYLAAGQRVVDSSDLMLALWNGQPSAGKGGTADVVHYATERGVRVIRLDPKTRTTRDLS